jgi:ABC-type uncharacterized transport system substrate-binding protein
VGFLLPWTPTAPHMSLLPNAVWEELRAFGYIEGQNIRGEFRLAENRFERLPALAAELVERNVDVVFPVASDAIRAAMSATTTVPIVMVWTGADPVAEGFIASPVRPGGNVEMSPAGRVSSAPGSSSGWRRSTRWFPVRGV